VTTFAWQKPMVDNQDASGQPPAGRSGGETERSSEVASFGLRRASELVQEAAYAMAGRVSPARVSRLIEIAAELDRFARTSGSDAGHGSGRD
jgi:hypothetical protein